MPARLDETVHPIEVTVKVGQRRVDAGPVGRSRADAAHPIGGVVSTSFRRNLISGEATHEG
jgi:hypothetical protein